MNKAVVLNKLKLLKIKNAWQISIVTELANYRGLSARLDSLYKKSCKRTKTPKDPASRRKYLNAIADLKKHSLLEENQGVTGPRVRLIHTIWKVEDAILESIASQTIKLSRGRKKTIIWTTILKEVRKELSTHHIIIPRQVTESLVRYILLQRCGWRLMTDQSLLPPKKTVKKKPPPLEHQLGLF